MNKNLVELINKYLSNTCTEEEKAVVEAWYRSFERNDNFLDMVSAGDQQLLEDKILGKIHQGIAEEELKTDTDAYAIPVPAARNRKRLLRIGYGHKRQVIRNVRSIILHICDTVFVLVRCGLGEACPVWACPEVAYHIGSPYNVCACLLYRVPGISPVSYMYIQSIIEIIIEYSVVVTGWTH